MKIKEMVVKGRGKFPKHMLYEDCCWPVTKKDEAMIPYVPQRDRDGWREVALRTGLGAFSEEKWAKLGWPKK